MRPVVVAIATCVLCIGTQGQDKIDVNSRTTVFSGPYEAEIIRIIDGDTVDVSVALWPGLWAEYSVRVKGIDAPELFRPDCEAEKIWAIEAREQAERLYPSGLMCNLGMSPTTLSRAESLPNFADGDQIDGFRSPTK